MRIAIPALVVALVGCSARRSGAEQAVDARLVEADIRWQDRSELGLEPVEELLLAGLRRTDVPDPAYLWRHSRLLVERGLAEEGDRRMAIDTYGAARSQAFRCLDGSTAWRQRRNESGLGAALYVLTDTYRPCLAWGTLAWARWIALIGGETASIDLDDVVLLAERVAAIGEPADVENARWALALVEASRPLYLGGDPGKAAQALRKQVEDHPNDLARHWDLLVLVAIPQGDQDLIARERAAIEAASPKTPADRAIKKRTRELLAPKE